MMSKKNAIIFLFFLLPLQAGFSQILKGKITSQSGGPVPYSTVYISELRQGTASNQNGDYEIRLPAGEYTITYQSLGYQPVNAVIKISEGTIEKNITLTLQYYSIPEVRISATGEDPAYSIMRKAIGMAPYYLNFVNSYKAEVYLKGNLVINRIPAIMKRSLKVEARNNDGTSVSSTSLKTGDTYLMESVNQIEFTAPDKYFQKVISVHSTFPAEGNQVSPMDFIEASFYQPVIAEIAISPLSPTAFSNYNFRYMGVSQQGNHSVAKIGVKPKRKSQQLFEGTIYIVEDLWCLQSVDLENDNIAGRVRIEQLFLPVQEDIWMPISHKFTFNISIIGFKADAGYGSSVRYNEVIRNQNLKRPDKLTGVTRPAAVPEAAKKTSEPNRSQREINSILEKDDLTNRDMEKLARHMKKESKASVTDSASKSLEIKDHTKYEIAKDAASRDSVWWSSVRPIPLSVAEKRSVRLSDSVKTIQKLAAMPRDSATTKDAKNSKFKSAVRSLFYGHTWSDSTGFSISYGGLADVKSLAFNTVDGYRYGNEFRISKNWKDGRSLNIYPQAGWAFSRKKPLLQLNAGYLFNGMKMSKAWLRAGMISRDLNNAGGISPMMNTISSLFQRKNYLKLYGSDYISAGLETEIINGLKIEMSAGFENRQALENTTSFSFSRKEPGYTPNFPSNSYTGELPAGSLLLSSMRHADFNVGLTWVPMQRYRIRENRKIYAGSDWPEFSLSWKHGYNSIPAVSESTKQYDIIKFEASQVISTGAFSEFRWRLRTGGALDSRNLSFHDFFHFNSQAFPVMLNNYQDAFMIPAFYSLSSPEFFSEVHLKYTHPDLILKKLPLISKTLMRENISLSALGRRYHPYYTEIGYSLSEILLMGEVGIYAGFDNLKYRSIGLRVILNLN